MVADKGKKPKVGDKNDDEKDEQIDSKFVSSIEKLMEIQDELEKINKKASDEVLEVEQKYNNVRKPVYDKRNDAIKLVPDFWLTSFLGHPALADYLTEEDQKIFKYLTSLKVEDYKDMKSGYSITFNFNSNAYFHNTKLIKTFTFLDEEGITKITATPIKWKEGMDVKYEKNVKKRPHEENGFFSWFSETEEQKDHMKDIPDQIAELIKEDLWITPLTYFNNDADEEEFDGDEDSEEEEEEEEEEEGDE